jgi:hypothetical protein
LDETLFKLGSISSEGIRRFRYPNAFQIERTTGPNRLLVRVEDTPLSWLWKLALPLAAPFSILYVLHTSRCGSQLGRYQSPSLDFEATNGFIAEFYEFLTNDSRHDLWVHSSGSDATVVVDRHDLIYAYGPLEQFRAVLKDGLSETRVEGPPYPHVHMYHAEYDESERKILRYFKWSRSPLLSGDQQI